MSQLACQLDVEYDWTYASTHPDLRALYEKAKGAQWDAAKSMIPQAQATLDSAVATRTFREKQLRRMQQLFKDEAAVDERLVDEKEDQRDAALRSPRRGHAR